MVVKCFLYLVWFQATAGLMITALILAVVGGCLACIIPVSAVLQLLAGE